MCRDLSSTELAFQVGRSLEDIIWMQFCKLAVCVIWNKLLNHSFQVKSRIYECLFCCCPGSSSTQPEDMAPSAPFHACLWEMVNVRWKEGETPWWLCRHPLPESDSSLFHSSGDMSSLPQTKISILSGASKLRGTNHLSKYGSQKAVLGNCLSGEVCGHHRDHKQTGPGSQRGPLGLIVCQSQECLRMCTQVRESYSPYRDTQVGRFHISLPFTLLWYIFGLIFSVVEFFH